jgi:hypothetical protein
MQVNGHMTAQAAYLWATQHRYQKMDVIGDLENLTSGWRKLTKLFHSRGLTDWLAPLLLFPLLPLCVPPTFVCKAASPCSSAAVAALFGACAFGRGRNVLRAGCSADRFTDLELVEKDESHETDQSRMFSLGALGTTLWGPRPHAGPTTLIRTAHVAPAATAGPNQHVSTSRTT